MNNEEFKIKYQEIEKYRQNFIAEKVKELNIILSDLLDVGVKILDPCDDNFYVSMFDYFRNNIITITSTDR